MGKSDELRPIRKLPEHVVNKIAAGEILQRPSSAVKELIENSIDAKSTLITVTVQDAGFKLLQLQDNGTGINKEDLNIICDRFTTSKLEQFTDLQSLTTHGFRGEALASISLVSSSFTIVTKTANSDLAFKASYTQGKLTGPIRPQAGNKGTLMSIENLFFNMPLRRESLANHSEEFNRISSLVTKYSLHYYWVGFALRRQGEAATNDFRTGPAESQRNKLADIYGSALAKDSIDLEITDCSELNLKCCGFVSRPCYVSKKYTFILFVNNRLIDFPLLKKSLLNIYTVYLLKGNNPFIYLNISIKGDEIDVNVHPTKEEVRMLHETEIVERISKKVDQILINANSNQQFLVKTINPFLSSSSQTSVSTPKSKRDSLGALDVLNSSQRSNSETPQLMVRTDPKLQSLDPFFTKRKSASVAPNQTSDDLRPEDLSNVPSSSASVSNSNSEFRNSFDIQKSDRSYPPRRTFKLNSLLNLRNKVEQSSCSQFREIISNCTYVGSSSPDIAFVQHATELWLVNMEALSRQLFYQIIIYDFGNFGRFTFTSSTIFINQLAELALTKSPKYKETYSKDENMMHNHVKETQEKFCSRSAMFLDYFSWQVDPESGQVKSFPLLLRNYEPSFEILPELVVELALKGCWDKEQECFDSFARIISNYYAISSRFWIHRPEDDWKYAHEHILLPAMKLFLQPNQSSSKYFNRIASLPQLYKVFERC